MITTTQQEIFYRDSVATAYNNNGIKDITVKIKL